MNINKCITAALTALTTLLFPYISHGQIITIDSRSATGVTINLDKGVYIASPYAGAFSYWDGIKPCDPCWAFNFVITSQLQTIPFNNGLFQTPEQALAEASDSTVMFSANGIVKFWINDNPYTDNRGSISLKIDKIDQQNFGDHSCNIQ